jgi:hypothetical protein
MLNAPGLFFGGTEGVGSHFRVLCSRTCFRRYRGRPVPFSCFALPEAFPVVPDSFLAVPRLSGSVFMFCAREHFFGETKGVGSHFHVLRARARFRGYQGRLLPFSCFVLSDTFSTVSRASIPVFMFRAPELVFGGIEGVGSLFHVLHCQNHFRRYRGRQVSFSYLERPDSFATVPRLSSPVFKFCALGRVFDGTTGIESRIQVLRV